MLNSILISYKVFQDSKQKMNFVLCWMTSFVMSICNDNLDLNFTILFDVSHYDLKYHFIMYCNVRRAVDVFSMILIFDIILKRYQEMKTTFFMLCLVDKDINKARNTCPHKNERTLIHIFIHKNTLWAQDKSYAKCETIIGEASENL